MANQLGKVNHIVQLMLENRSFEQMLGFLYSGSSNVSAAGGLPYSRLHRLRRPEASRKGSPRAVAGDQRRNG